MVYPRFQSKRISSKYLCTQSILMTQILSLYIRQLCTHLTVNKRSYYGYGYKQKIDMLNNIKPYKVGWKIEVKVIESWIQPTRDAGDHTIEFIFEDKIVFLPYLYYYFRRIHCRSTSKIRCIVILLLQGVRIQCTCQSVFADRVKNLIVSH